MNVWLAVGLGGCAGALARHGVALLVARLWTTPWPVATFAINVSGSFLLGLFVAWAAAHTDFGPNWRPLIATGFLGAYTTFSTFELETQRLAETGFPVAALLNVLLSVVAGYLALLLGMHLAR